MHITDTWSEWKQAFLKCNRIENFMEELNNKQNTESDGLRNFPSVGTQVYLIHAVIPYVLVVCCIQGGPQTFVDPNHAFIL